ncbi:MAG: TonB-dependent receptor [Acidobacteriota bacterium]|nr:TonB-dependent receptor [Acidobacteriota bacterium]
MILAALLALALEEPAASPPGARVREDVVVTAARGAEREADASGTVSVLRREDIERLPARSLDELLAFVPGVFAFFRGAGAGAQPMLTARGFFGGGEVDYVQLRIDGLPVQDAESGLGNWRAIPAAAIERVEFLRGPASALYGDTSLGGVVQVFTRRDSGLAAGISAGSFGAADADAAGTLVVGDVVLRSSVRAARADGFRAHAASDRAGGDASLSTRLGDGLLNLEISLDREAREEPGALLLADAERGDSGSSPLFRFDHATVTRRRATIAWAKEGAWRAALYAGSRTASLLRTLLVAPGLGDRTLRDLSASVLGGTLDAERVVRLGALRGRLRAGAEVSREGLGSVYRAVDAGGEAGDVVAASDGRRDRLGVLGSIELSPAEGATIVAGVRWDAISDAFDAKGRRYDALSPRVSARARAGRILGLAVSVSVEGSSAFKAPTLDQLFDPHPFPGPGGSFTISNPGLTPQRATTVQAGLAARSAELDFEVTAYRTAVDDEIDFDTATFRYRNIGRSLHAGLEAGARWKPPGPVSIFASWAFTSASPRDGPDAGKQLKNVPRQLLALGLTVSLPAGLQAEAVLHGMAGRFADDSNAVPMRSAIWLDARLTRSFARVRAFLDLLNVTGARFSEVGFVLPGLRGETVAYGYPTTALQARVGVSWASAGR